MKNCVQWFGASIAAVTLLCGSAHAEDAPAAPTGPTVAFNAALTTDYLFRGLSQTSGDAAASGGVDVTYKMFYAGTWLSKVNFGPTVNDPQNKTSIEYDIYGGVRPVWGPVTFDIGLIRYGYVDSPSAANYEYFEAKLLANYVQGPIAVGGAFYYSPAFFGDTGSAEYYEINGGYTLKSKASISGAVGYQSLDKDKAGLSGYTTWNIGIGYPITDHFAIDLRYWGTDSHASNFYTKTFAGDRLVGTLKATF
jgi:uncharacterized protein (TIGR02001 family)